MNSFRYEFCEENKKYLLHFLKVASEQKTSRFCNLNEHGTLSKFLPLDEHLEEELKDYISKQTSIIDITQSDEEDDVENKFQEAETISTINENLETTAENVNLSTVDDITYSIKEHLETEKGLSGPVLNSLRESKINPDQIFSLLSQELNFEEVLNFGISLQTVVVSDIMISYYIQYLLIKKINLEYSNQLQDVLNEFSTKYSDILLEELTKALCSAESQSKVFLQFIDGLHMEFKTKLFRKFVFSCENVQEKHIGVVEILINSQVDYNTLNKLTEMLSNAASNFSTDKSFGRLLTSVIKLVGKNVVLLEQPLKHVIGSHKTIWRSQIEKAFEDCLQDSLTMSQSFRY